ncbi:hypothetical protein Patl1_37627 [Pistacia atlantica]|nr:hypothetical protein Patl1_37627 [Pistacia atlantica]
MDKNLNLLSALNSGCFNEEGFPEAELSEAGNHSPRAGIEQKEIPSFCSSVLGESVNSSLSVGEVLTEITDNKNSQTPQSLFYTKGVEDQENSEVSPLRSDRKLSSRSIWSRRGKAASVLQIQTGRSGGKTTRSHRGRRNLYSKQGEFLPRTLPLKSLKRKGKLEKIKPCRSYRKSSSKVTISPNIQPVEDLNFSSDKENHQTPKGLQEQKLAGHASRNQVNLEEERAIMKKRTERVPFQSLVANSSGRRGSEASLSNATTSSHSVNLSQTMKVTNSSSIGERRRSWAMVVDAITLLDKESRRSL